VTFLYDISAFIEERITEEIRFCPVTEFTDELLKPFKIGDNPGNHYETILE